MQRASIKDPLDILVSFKIMKFIHPQLILATFAITLTFLLLINCKRSRSSLLVLASLRGGQLKSWLNIRVDLPIIHPLAFLFKGRVHHHDKAAFYSHINREGVTPETYFVMSIQDTSKYCFAAVLLLSFFHIGSTCSKCNTSIHIGDKTGKCPNPNCDKGYQTIHWCL